MTKAELVSIIRDRINEGTEFKKREASLKVVSAVVNSFFDVMKEHIAKGNHIELRGFGTFETRIREPKKAINPRTKEIVDVERHAVPIFRSGKELRSVVREYFNKNLNK